MPLKMNFDFNSLIDNLTDLGKTIYLSEAQRKALEKQIKSSASGNGSGSNVLYYPAPTSPGNNQGTATQFDYSKYLLPVALAAFFFILYKKFL